MNLQLAKNIRKALFVSTVLTFPLAASAMPGFYAQIQGGLSDWQGKDTVALKFPKDSPVFRAAIGYLGSNYNASCWEFGWEVGAATYPHLKRGHAHVDQTSANDEQVISANADGTVALKGYSIDLLAAAKYNFNPRFNAFAKVGVAYLNEQIVTKIKAVDQNDNLAYRFDGRVNDHQFAPEVMLGVGYHLNQKVEASLALSEIFAGKVNENNVPVAATSSLMLGITYYFS